MMDHVDNSKWYIHVVINFWTLFRCNMAVAKITILDLTSKILNLLDDVNGFYCQLNSRCAFLLIMVKFVRRDGKTF